MAHHQLARQTFHDLKIMYTNVFDLVDWEMVHKTLHNVPKLFQQWASKQVMGIAGTMEWDRSEQKKCPSCMQEQDTCAHVLACNHAGRVETLRHTIDIMENWMNESETDPDLLDCIAEYAHGQGGRTMIDICQGLGEPFQKMAREQDAIGWRQFMEGMICKSMRWIQGLHHFRQGTRMSPDRWAQGLVLKLLEATHGQWIYRNIQIHDCVAGTQATLRKEELQREIEKQLELGVTGLLEEDQWLMEINLGDMESNSGEQEEYWLVAMKAAREAAMLKWQMTEQTQEEPFGDGR
jgi:hypothetical protein